MQQQRGGERLFGRASGVPQNECSLHSILKPDEHPATPLPQCASIPTYEGFRTPPPEMRDAHRSKSGGGNAAHLRARAARNLTSARAEPTPPPPLPLFCSRASLSIPSLPPGLLLLRSGLPTLFSLAARGLVPHARTFSGKFRGTGQPREIHSLTTLTLTASWDRSLRGRRVRATVRFLSRSPRSFRHELERACGPGQATGSVGSRW